MKKSFLSVTALALSLAACNTAPKYSINGTVEGEQSGNVLLVRSENGTMDTLAKAPLAGGKFTLTGNVTELTDAYVVIEGKRGATPIFLENLTYTATLNPKDPSATRIEGSDIQNLANQFLAVGNDTRKIQSQLYKDYSAAAQEKNEEKMKEIEESFNQAGEKAEAKEDSLLRAHADSYVAAYMIAQKMGGLEVEKLTEKYGMLGEQAKATQPGKKIAERIQKLSAVAVGQVAPDFTLNTPEGQPLSMHSIKGKVKLIDFWASWCGPCRGENPNVVKVYEEFHPKGLEILSVSLDSDKDAWLKAIEDDHLTWNHVSDLKGWQNEAAQMYGVNGIPHLIVVDENNVILAKNLRGEELKNKIAELLK